MPDTSWIKKKERSDKWITKKKTTADPTKWITKKSDDTKKKNWITKKKNWITKKKNWITKKSPNPDLRKNLTDALAGGIKGKPHSSPEGRVASAGRKLSRMIERTKVDPDATVGGTRIKKQGPEIKVSNTQADLSKIKRMGRPDRYGGGKKYNKGGRAGFQHGGRTNLLEELGRVEAEPSNRNRRAEISRVHGELNRGYKGGKRVKYAGGGGNRPRPQGPHMWVKGHSSAGAATHGWGKIIK